MNAGIPGRPGEYATPNGELYCASGARRNINHHIGGYLRTTGDYVHRLIAKTFLPPPSDPEATCVNHIDGNTLNNAVKYYQCTPEKGGSSDEVRSIGYILSSTECDGTDPPRPTVGGMGGVDALQVIALLGGPLGAG